MGYLIDRQILKTQVVLTASQVSNLDGTPVLVFDRILGIPENNYTILAAQLSTTDNLTFISGFGHFYLQYDVTQKFAIYDENVGIILPTNRSNFMLNMSHPPNIFGSYTIQLLRDLRISSQNPPIIFGGGNGELAVTVYYFNNF